MTIVFLDRDGVINENKEDYVRTIDEFIPIPGAIDAIASLSGSGISIAIISNQAGVGRGLIDPDELIRIDNRMMQLIEEGGGNVAGTYYCTHRKEEGCSCRKPETGLLIQACKEIGADNGSKYLVGDAKSDMDAGKSMGCRTVFVLSGRTPVSEMESWNSRPDHVAADLRAAAEWILYDIHHRDRV